MANLRVRIPRLLRLYLWVLGAGLLIEGAAMLMLGALPVDRLAVAVVVPEPDPLHNAIHVVWGLAILCLLVAGLGEVGTSLLGLGFGVFYVALGFLGLFVHHPFGLLLGPGENAFHFIVGPAALLLGMLAFALIPDTRAA